MSHNPATELASAIQSAHLVRDPSPHHDINPSTAASRRIPANIPPSPSPSDIDDADDADAASDIPSSVLHPPPIPRPRRKSFPPLPDMRFEQSYLASLKTAETKSQIAYITIRDQVLLPLLQGTLWNFVLFGWRHWNRGAQFRGQGWGARVRKWWWGVNGWKVPGGGGGGGVRGQNGARGEFARQAEEYYVGQAGSSLGD